MTLANHISRAHWRTHALQTHKAVEARLEAIVFPPAEDGSDPHACPACGAGRLYLRSSAAHGAFVACSNYKDREADPCTYRRPMLPGQAGDISLEEAMAGRPLGTDPQSGHSVRLMHGPYGRCAVSLVLRGRARSSPAAPGARARAVVWPASAHTCFIVRRYVERNDGAGSRDRKALPTALAAETITLAQALDVLNATDEVLGKAPGCELDVLIKEGRFGPYYSLGKLNASFGRTGEDFEPSIQHAVTRLEAKAEKLGARSVHVTPESHGVADTQTSCTACTCAVLVQQWLCLFDVCVVTAAQRPQGCRLAFAGFCEIASYGRAGVTLAKAAEQGGSPKSRKAKPASKKGPKAKAKSKGAEATKGRRGAARTGAVGADSSPGDAVGGKGASRASGTRAYHAWVAQRRKVAGESLQAARAAYSALSEAERLAWKDEWLAGQAAAAP